LVKWILEITSINQICGRGRLGLASGMRAVIQRVSEASVTINGRTVSAIKTGILLLLGVEEGDTPEDIEWLSGKIARMRIFNDEEGLMNRSVQEVEGEALVVSQFTLFASTKKGNRPSYSRAARPEVAVPIYEAFLKKLSQDLGKPVQAGEFGADMEVGLVNDGPVTILMDTKAKE
jgi:D-aminoacyl-tRNA deacylase